MLREKHDEEIDEIRKRYARKFASVQTQIDKAKARVDRETKEYHSVGTDSAVTVGTSILGALFGRKWKSVSNTRRASTSAKSVTRAAREREDVVRAKEALQEQLDKRAKLDAELKADIAEIRETLRPDQIDLEKLTVKSRKKDLKVDKVELVWLPFIVDAEGIARAAFSR